jgi:hypothetical protein
MVAMRRLALVALLAVACGATQAHAQALVLAYQPGETFAYNFHATSTGEINVIGTTAPVNTELTALETATVQSVDTSGVATVSIALSNLTIKSSVNGVTNTTTGLPLPATELRIAPDGRILTVNGTTMEAQLPFTTGYAGTIVSAVLPDGLVKPGDTWSKNYDQPDLPGFSSGSVSVMTNSKYLRNESFHGVNAAVIETTSTATIDLTINTSKLAPPSPSTTPFPVPPGGVGAQGLTIKGTTTSDVTTWIDPGAHRILKSHMTAKTSGTLTILMAPGSKTPPPLGPTSMNGNETFDLQPA